MIRRAKFEDKEAAINAKAILIRHGFYVFSRYEPLVNLYIIRWF